MTSHRTITAFLAIVVLAAATTTAALRPHAPNPGAPEFAVVLGAKPAPEARKPVRYEAVIENWKRYRSSTRSSG